MHKAIVAKITEVVEIPGADFIHIGRVLGENVVVSKEWGVGFVGVLFPTDLQLSEDFCHHNNLFRDATKNKDTERKGFFEASRRVRAQPFLKVRSEGFFTTLDSLAYTGVELSKLELGQEFDTLNDVQICQKYVTEKARMAQGNKANKAAKKNYAPFFEKHVDSEQFRLYAHTIKEGSLLSFHAKVHGTSARMSYTPVTVDLPLFKRLLNKIAPFFEETRWEYVVGTRNVVLFDEKKEGFHGAEQFRFDVMNMVKPYLEKGMTIYGEIAGFANSKSIMPKHSVATLKDKKYTKKYGDEVTYSYGCKEHEFRFHVYRITYLNHTGVSVDMSQKQMEQWCADRGLNATFEVHPQIIYDGDVDRLCKLVENLTDRPDVLTEDYIDPSHVSEGIIVRIDNGNMRPKFLKSKSFAFRVMEGHCEAVDEETIS